MKVVHINSVYGYGSTGKIVMKLHHELLDRGHDSYVIYGRKGAFGHENNNKYSDNSYLVNNSIETIVHLILGVLFDKHGLYSKNSTNRIIKLIDDIKPDIIHLHNLHGFYINYEMLFKYIASKEIKVIWTLHDCWSFTGFCSHYEYNSCDKWKSGCHNCQYRNVYPYRILSRSEKNYELKLNLYKDIENLTIVTPSRWLADQVKESILRDKKIIVINNEANLNDFYLEDNARRSKELDGKTILLAVSNGWNIRKGFNEYLKLSKKLDENQIIVMIGLNDKQIKNLPKNIIGIKRTKSVDELRKWYSISDYFVNLTLEDTYPTVNLEAQSCGLPVITYRTGGSTEMMRENDFVVDKFDLDEICRIISKKSKHIVSKGNNNMIEEYMRLYND